MHPASAPASAAPEHRPVLAVRWFKRFESGLVWVEKAFLVASLSIMLFINVAQIAGRPLELNIGRWTDLMLILLPWVGLVGAALGVHLQRHIGFTFVRNNFPPIGRAVLLGIALAATLTFFVLLVYSGTAVVLEQYDLGGTTAQMHIPRWVSTASVPVCGVLMCFHCVVSLGSQFRNVMSDRPDSHEAAALR